MKRGLFVTALIVMFATSSWGYGIVNNSGSTAADSVCMTFYYADTLGQPVAGAANDSVWVRVFYPSGAVAYADSFVYTSGEITASAFGDGSLYSIAFPTADIDGTPVEGAYAWTLTAKDNSLSLLTVQQGGFQLYAGADFDAALDYLDASVATVDGIVDDIIDTLESQDGWVAKEATVATVDGIVDDIIDTLESHDGWVAQEASLLTAANVWNFTLIDSSAATHVDYRDSALGSTLDSQAHAGYFAAISGDSSSWAQVADVWRNQDTANVDSSDIGDWIVNNAGGGAGGSDSATVTAACIAAFNADTTAAFKQFTIINDDATGHAFLCSTSAAGYDGFKASSDSGHGLAGYSYATSTGADPNYGGIYGYGNESDGLRLQSDAGEGIMVNGVDIGMSVNSSNGPAVKFLAAGNTNAHGLHVEGTGTNAYGLYANGGTGVGHGIYGDGDGTGTGLVVDGNRFDSSAIYGTLTALVTDSVVGGAPKQWTANDSTAYQGAAGSLDSTAVYGAIQQSVIDTIVGGAPNQWDADDTTAYRGEASGITINRIYDTLAILANDSSVARVDSSQSWKVRGIASWADGGTGENHALYLAGTGAGEGLYGVGGATGGGAEFVAGGASQAGIASTGGSSASGFYTTGGEAGIHAFATQGSDGAGIKAEGSSDGVGGINQYNAGIYAGIHGGTGFEHGHGAYFRGGGDSGDGLKAFGPSYTGSGATFVSYGPYGNGFRIWGSADSFNYNAYRQTLDNAVPGVGDDTYGVGYGAAMWVRGGGENSQDSGDAIVLEGGYGEGSAIYSVNYSNDTDHDNWEFLTGNSGTNYDIGARVDSVQKAPTGTATVSDLTIKAIADTLDNRHGSGTWDKCPADAEYGFIEGYMYGLDGDTAAYEGAKVYIHRGKGVAVIDSISSNAVMYGYEQMRFIGQDGTWRFTVPRTSQYHDTTHGLYTVTAFHNNKELWTVKDIPLPDTGLVNIGDLITISR